MPADVRIAASPIAGRGLFAAGPVAAGELVAVINPDDVAAFGPVNHSCDPNLGWDGSGGLVAVRDIPEGTELTTDYSTAITDPAWVLYCHCGTYRCRQAVEGTDWRIPQLRRRYVGRWHPRVAALIASDEA